jgi:hypothetical protein
MLVYCIFSTMVASATTMTASLAAGAQGSGSQNYPRSALRSKGVSIYVYEIILIMLYEAGVRTLAKGVESPV